MHSLGLREHLPTAGYLLSVGGFFAREDFSANGVLRPFELGLVQRVAALAPGKSWFDYHQGHFEALLATTKEGLTDQLPPTSEESPEVVTIP
jgi:hypothetical protein